MTTTIGPAGIDAAAPLGDPSNDGGISENGADLTLSGQAHSQTLAAAQALQSQIAGLTDARTDAFVPVVCSLLPRLNGFYGVREASAAVDKLPGGWRTHWTVALQRPVAYRFGGVEVAWERYAIPNTLGVGTWHFHLVTPYGSAQTAGDVSMAGYLDSYAAEGPMSRFWMSSSTSGDYQRGIVGYQIDPTLYYRGRARVEQSPDGGTTWYSIVGAQAAPSPQVRIANGFVRCTPTLGTCGFGLSWWNGSGWTPPKAFLLAGFAGATWTSALVLANTLDNVTVRLFAGAGGGPYIADINLRRADRFVEVVVQVPGATGVTTASFETGSAITGGYKAATFDGFGIGYVLSSDQPFNGSSGGIVLASAASTARLMVGATINGLPSYLMQDVQSLVYDFLGHDSQRSRLTVGS